MHLGYPHVGILVNFFIKGDGNMQKNFILKSIIPKGFIAGMRLNGFAINNQYDIKPLNIHYLIIPFKLGGIINFESTFQPNENILKDYVQTLLIDKFYNLSSKRKKHRWFGQAENTRAITFSLGNYVKGFYKADDGLMYDENSISIEIRGIEKDELIEIALAICKKYNLSVVLIKENENHNLFTLTVNENQNDKQ